MDDRQIPVADAEKIVGKRLDRRRIYALIQNQVCELVSWTDSCSGCFEGGEYMGMAHYYPYDKKAHCHVGAGCCECGYTGKRIRKEWVPVNGG